MFQPLLRKLKIPFIKVCSKGDDGKSADKGTGLSKGNQAMELSGISPASISAAKQVQVESEAGVRVAKGANEQAEAVSSIIMEGVKEAPRPAAEGKGDKINIKA